MDYMGYGWGCRDSKCYGLRSYWARGIMVRDKWIRFLRVRGDRGRVIYVTSYIGYGL